MGAPKGTLLCLPTDRTHLCNGWLRDSSATAGNKAQEVPTETPCSSPAQLFSHFQIYINIMNYILLRSICCLVPICDLAAKPRFKRMSLPSLSNCLSCWSQQFYEEDPGDISMQDIQYENPKYVLNTKNMSHMLLPHTNVKMKVYISG